MNSMGVVKSVRFGRRNGSWSVLLAVGLLSVVAVSLVFARYGVAFHTPAYWFLLPLSAFLAELIPISLRHRGLNVTFTLPFVFGVAVAIGPVAALATDLTATMVGALVMAFSGHKRFSPYWTYANLVIVATAMPVAYFSLKTAEPNLWGLTGATHLGALLFLLVYAVTNFLLVTALNSSHKSAAKSEPRPSSMAMGVKTFALYAVLFMVVAALYRAHGLLAIPLTLVPVWAYRTAVAYRDRMTDYYVHTIGALADMLERTHPYTQGHVERVAWTAEEVGRRLGLPSHRARLLREAAVLHDIGKIAVDERILDKPSRLTQEEMDHVRTHAVSGAKILSPVLELQPIVAWVQHHHERPDGTGYPSGLVGDQIPLESRVIAVIDAFDAMTGGDGPGQDRPYRKRMSVSEAIVELERCSGTQFDPAVVQCFKLVVKEGGLAR